MVFCLLRVCRDWFSTPFSFLFSLLFFLSTLLSIITWNHNKRRKQKCIHGHFTVSLFCSLEALQTKLVHVLHSIISFPFPAASWDRPLPAVKHSKLWQLHRLWNTVDVCHIFTAHTQGVNVFLISWSTSVWQVDCDSTESREVIRMRLCVVQTWM